jgi:hypothetical protein
MAINKIHTTNMHPKPAVKANSYNFQKGVAENFNDLVNTPMVKKKTKPMIRPEKEPVARKGFTIDRKA